MSVNFGLPTPLCVLFMCAFLALDCCKQAEACLSNYRRSLALSCRVAAIREYCWNLDSICLTTLAAHAT